MMNWGPGFGWGGMAMGFLMMLVFWGGLIGLGVLVLWALTRPASGRTTEPNSAAGPREDNAMALLRERYARGEITREQFQEMRDELGR